LAKRLLGGTTKGRKQMLRDRCGLSRLPVQLLGTSVLTLLGCGACNTCTGTTEPQPGAHNPATLSSSLSRDGRAEGGAAEPAPQAADWTEKDRAARSEVQMPEPPSLPGQRKSTRGPEANREIFSSYGLPGYPELVHLCGRIDFEAGNQRLIWDAFCSSQPTAMLIEYYQLRLGRRGYRVEGANAIWELPAGAPDPQRRLWIGTPDAAGRHQSCATAPPATAKTVLVLSRR
jgi:hypothetical protein